MTSESWKMDRPRVAVATLAVFLGASGCAELEKEREVTVTVEGPTSIALGDRAQLEAVTRNTEDASYAWRSSDDAIASVADDGLVSAIAAGEVTITATGDSSGVEGSHPVVVLAALGASVPHYEEWAGSGHAHREAEAFTHWDEDGEVEVACARCHSSDGFLDYIGADGTAAMVVDGPGTTGAVIDCQTCHDPATEALSSVVFPSGEEVVGLGPEARCMTCHQGRAAADTVNAALVEVFGDEGADAEDEVSEELSFQNIHYYPAGATLLAGSVRGGYQYDGETYDWRFRHVPGYDVCTGCHDPHSLEVRVEQCAGCHEGVSGREDLRDIRMLASHARDYDGDGDHGEGIFYEIQGMRAVLLQAIQAYATTAADSICYSEQTYPYWFIDGDGSGDCGDDEAVFPNQYGAWTPRLLKATYNYQMATKDPGAFAHNAKYIIQLLFDSIASIKEVPGTAIGSIDTSGLTRNDVGHFNGASEAARHWDEDDEVAASCSKCHSGAAGFRAYVDLGVTVDVGEPDNGMDCATCHASFGLEGDEQHFELIAVDEVLYPSGLTVEDPGNESNLCRTCHVGRAAGSTVQGVIDSGELGFVNVHYLPAASVKLGVEAGLGYEYPGRVYAAEWKHGDNNDCTSCHDPVLTSHSFRAEDAFEGKCATCHADAGDTENIRSVRLADYDGNGDAEGPLSSELAGLAQGLLAQLQLVAANAGEDICYDEHAYPYFFADADADGVCGPGEAIFPNAYAAWTPELLVVAHNYQISQKDPGAWAHNFDYMAQLLIDGIEELGGDVSRYVRPGSP